MRQRRRRLPIATLLPKKINHRPHVDYVLVGGIFFVIIFGLAVLSSATSVQSFRDYHDSYHLFRHQLLFGVLPGLVLFFVFTRIDYRKLDRYTVYFFAAMMILLLLVFIPGLGATWGTSNSWVTIAGLSLQPSEVAKLFLILVLASWFSQRGEEFTADFWNGLFPFILLLGVVSVPIILQPDIGTLAVVVTIAGVMYFVAGARLRHLLMLAMLSVASLVALIIKAPYRAERLLVFLNPEADPSGIGYHINQALLAVGSGGLFGLGFGQSRQKFAYLPQVLGDSIFAILAEELGFFFSVLLIFAFLLILIRGVRLAKTTDDAYGRYIVIGIVAWFTLQAYLNIAAMVGLVPLTGIPLPFISYGGTAFFSAMAGAGILINISRHAK